MGHGNCNGASCILSFQPDALRIPKVFSVGNIFPQEGGYYLIPLIGGEARIYYTGLIYYAHVTQVAIRHYFGHLLSSIPSDHDDIVSLSHTRMMCMSLYNSWTAAPLRCLRENCSQGLSHGRS